MLDNGLGILTRIEKAESLMEGSLLFLSFWNSSTKFSKDFLNCVDAIILLKLLREGRSL